MVKPSWRFMSPRDIGLFLRSARSDAQLARVLATGAPPSAAFDRLYAEAEEHEPWGAGSPRYRYQRGKYDALVALLPRGRRFRRSLDIGCGTGLLADRLAAHSDEVVGIDVSAVAIERAREWSASRPGLRFMQADLLALDPAHYHGFDLVVVADAIYYLPPDALDDAGLKSLVSRLARLLTPDGILLLANHYFAGFDPDSRVSRRIHDAFRWSPAMDLIHECRRPFWLASLFAPAAGIADADRRVGHAADGSVDESDAGSRRSNLRTPRPDMLD